MPGLSLIALGTSFAAGIVSFLSPCVLPLGPGYISYIGGRSLAEHADARARMAALPLSVLFVLGFSTVFIALGASATAVGQLLLAYRYQANFIAGAVVILFGLLMIGLIRGSWLQRDIRFRITLQDANPLSAYILGLAFALGWTPCIGPVLGTILTTGAISATVSQGIVLLSAYSFGLALPFLGAALVTERILRRVARLGHVGRSMQLAAGGVMVLMGVAMITGQLSAFSYWLLETFPSFARIG